MLESTILLVRTLGTVSIIFATPRLGNTAEAVGLLDRATNLSRVARNSTILRFSNEYMNVPYIYEILFYACFYACFYAFLC